MYYPATLPIKASRRENTLLLINIHINFIATRNPLLREIPDDLLKEPVELNFIFPTYALLEHNPLGMPNGTPLVLASIRKRPSITPKTNCGSVLLFLGWNGPMTITEDNSSPHNAHGGFFRQWPKTTRITGPVSFSHLILALSHPRVSHFYLPRLLTLVQPCKSTPIRIATKKGIVVPSEPWF